MRSLSVKLNGFNFNCWLVELRLDLWRIIGYFRHIPKTQTALSMVEKISAVTLRVANMEASVRFYKDVLGLEIIYGGEGSYFTSLRTKDGDTILNLEHGNAGIQWGRLIFHVSDVDRFWAYLTEKGFYPDSPHDASWGERYFHMPDPDGHELSFARPF
jgi:catechol 2,3-dioxygenase-like lactoylglutathione lyase family enzyme